ncbi:protein CDV3 homolog [Nematostella vectensis]|uniref:protein CDV3 homolog n=1 Tax=Nematostella vectensis TaxID=45351 RepID=UPI00207788E2|nr:protein CDV3 homolog [Nematostella vectensis]
MSEDKSLEDFFAKKKAKKGKNKFTTSQAITQQVGSTKKESEKTKEQTNKRSSSSNHTASKKEEEDWIDFQQPAEKDYSGLRIQTLQISEKSEQEGAESCEQEENDENGDGGQRKDKSNNPWQSGTAPTQDEPVNEPEPECGKVTGGVYRPPAAYRPPGMRTRTAMSGGVKGKAPEIGSEIAFPSLQHAAQANKSKEPAGSKSFEPVKHGSRTAENPADRRPKLDLENKFDALRRS